MESADDLTQHKIAFVALCLVAVLLSAFIVSWLILDRYTFEYTAYSKIDQAEVVTLETECIRLVKGVNSLVRSKEDFIKTRELGEDSSGSLIIRKGCNGTIF